MAYF
jgi:vesicle coat complex subunit